MLNHKPGIPFLTCIGMLLLVTCQAVRSQENGYDQDVTNVDLDYNLILVASEGDSVLVHKLLDAGARVNAVTYEGVTALMYAAQGGYSHIVQLLIDRGADIDRVASNGHTALISAIRSGWIQTAELLIRNGARIDQGDRHGLTPLMHAIAVDSFFIPDMLLYYGADISHRSEEGINALMVACRSGRYVIAGRLIEMGSDVNEADLSGRTALHFAAMQENTELLELILLSGAEMEQRTESGYTPLAAAAEMNNFEASRLLIGYGADVNSKVSRAINPIALALRNDNTALAQMLRNNGAYDNLWPYFGQYEVGSEFSLHQDFTELRIFMAVRDEKFNLRAKAGWGFWLKPTQILVQEDKGIYYQYREKRSALYLSLEKDLFLWHAGKRKKAEIGIFAGLSSNWTFGRRSGSATRPEAGCYLTPRTGISLSYAIGKLTFGYEYAHLGLYKSNKGRFNISVSLLLNRRKGKLNTDWEL